MNSKRRWFKVTRNIIVTIIAVVALIMAGFPAPAESADITVIYNVTNPNFSITSSLTDHQTGNSNTTTVECSAVGSGYAVGGMENNIETETGWNLMAGEFYGSQVDMSSTFQVQSYRNVEGTTSTFDTRQAVSATNVGPLPPDFSPGDDLISGMRIYGEGGACDTTDTWALGLYQEFEGTAEYITVPAENQFEQRDPTGALIGTPVDNQFTVNSAGGNWFTGSGEGGSYEGSYFGLSNPPGFGFAANTFYLDVREDSSTVMNIDTVMYTDQVVGGTTTWFEHPDYPNPPNP